MSAVSEIIVREYFELHGFLVRQQRKFIAPSKEEDEEIDFLVVNPACEPAAPARPFVLESADLRGIERAVIVVKGWHTETFGPAVLTHAPQILRFVEPAVLKQAVKGLGGAGAPTKILVVPGLPSGREARQQTIDLLQSKGLDAVIPFRTMLADLIDHVEVNRNYQKSDLLQILRVLKNYDFLKGPQMELFKPRKRRRKT
jgi:hypothetical protein